MESTVEVALATKLLKVMPQAEDSFLCFPLSGAGFTQSELTLFEQPGESAEDIRLRGLHKSQFARTLNQIPVDSLSYDTTGADLGDEYQRVLTDAQMATSTLAAAEATALRQARGYLEQTVQTETGPATVYSAAVVAYYQHKDAADEVERTYLDAKLTAELSDDPAVKTAWDDGGRQALEEQRTRAAQDWQTLGHKADVEAAQATVAALGGKSPQVLRVALLADYEHCLEPDLVSNDPVGVPSTFYSPSDVMSDATTWTTLRLSGEELSALVADAPPELAGRLASSPTDISSVTVEYAVATVVRPWFDPSFLQMRSWRLPEGEVVSDGATPRRGRIPGYITDMVVARKVTVVRRGVATDATPGHVVPEFGYLSRALTKMSVQRRFSTDVGATTISADPPAATLSVDAVGQAVDVSTLRNPVIAEVMRGTSVSRLATRPAVRSMVGRGATLRPDNDGELPDPDLPFPRRPPIHVTVPPQPLPPPWVPPAPPTPAPSETVEEITVDGVVVLAYRARRVPTCPDPDASLAWDAATDVDPTPQPAPGGDTSAETHGFPLAGGRVFGTPASATVHDGRVSAADRVGILDLQSALKSLSWPVTVTGIYDEATSKAVRGFQRNHAMRVTGRTDAATWTAVHRVARQRQGG